MRRSDNPALNSPTAAQIRSDGSIPPNCGGVDFSIPSGLTVADLDNLSTMAVTFESADSCKKGGYQQFTSAPGPFRHQGQCVSYFAKGG